MITAEAALRTCLLAGLIFHKAVWEIAKRRSGCSKAKPVTVPFRLRLVKAAKIGILTGLLAQVVLPDILPLSSKPAASRAAGIVLFGAGLALAVTGRLQLGDNWLDIESAAVKNRQAVVSEGLYRYLRHPIYVGDLTMLLGFELALNSWCVLLVLLLTPAVLRQAIAEERLLRSSLPGYDLYCRRTRRFIPFLA